MVSKVFLHLCACVCILGPEKVYFLQWVMVYKVWKALMYEWPICWHFLLIHNKVVYMLTVKNTWLAFCQSTWHQIPGDCTLQSPSLELQTVNRLFTEVMDNPVYSYDGFGHHKISLLGSSLWKSPKDVKTIKMMLELTFCFIFAIRSTQCNRMLQYGMFMCWQLWYSSSIQFNLFNVP
jgi:hypothetical protein